MENFAYEVVETARLIRRAFNRRATALGSTRSQWRVLARLAKAGDGVRQVELADALDLEPITLCRVIDRLEEAGFVERRKDETDRRAWLIHLTDKAHPIIEELHGLADAFHGDILAGIPDKDREVALGVLAHVRRNLDLIEADMKQAS